MFIQCARLDGHAPKLPREPEDEFKARIHHGALAHDGVRTLRGEDAMRILNDESGIGCWLPGVCRMLHRPGFCAREPRGSTRNERSTEAGWSRQSLISPGGDRGAARDGRADEIRVGISQCGGRSDEERFIGVAGVARDDRAMERFFRILSKEAGEDDPIVLVPDLAGADACRTLRSILLESICATCATSGLAPGNEV
jgi:hypothetical protein